MLWCVSTLGFTSSYTKVGTAFSVAAAKACPGLRGVDYPTDGPSREKCDLFLFIFVKVEGLLDFPYSGDLSILY